MRKNRLRELLRAGKPSLGTHLFSTWPAITELVGYSGVFDYIEFSGEYAPYDLYSLDNLGRAIDLFDHMSGMMKIDQQPRTYLAIRAVSAGIQNILFADVRTVADVEEAVASVRAETPQTAGHRGAADGRNTGICQEGGTRAYVQAMEDAVVALMIEKKQAVDDLEAILSVKGVDMVQFGPADYAMSIGMPGEWFHPQVREAERYVIETALKKGIAPRAEVNDPSDAKRYLDMGVRHFCMGADVVILLEWFKEKGTAMKGLLS